MKRNNFNSNIGDIPNKGKFNCKFGVTLFCSLLYFLVVTLVDRNTQPFGVELISPIAVGKKTPNDLVELAMEIQKVTLDSIFN